MYPYIQFSPEDTEKFLKHMCHIWLSTFQNFMMTISLHDLVEFLKELPYEADQDICQIAVPTMALKGHVSLNCKDHALYVALWCQANKMKTVNSWDFARTADGTHIYVNAVIMGVETIIDPLEVVA